MGSTVILKAGWLIVLIKKVPLGARKENETSLMRLRKNLQGFTDFYPELVDITVYCNPVAV